MIYLIRNNTVRHKTSILKIGFTDNLKIRISQYYHYNPGTTLLSSREGSEIEETKLHLYLTHKGYKYGRLNEWFLDVPEVLGDFHKSIQEIDSYLWKNREEILCGEFYANLKKSKILEAYKTISHKSYGIIDEFEFLYYFQVNTKKTKEPDRYVWENREILFRNLSFSDQRVKEIYEDLREKYSDTELLTKTDSRYVDYVVKNSNIIKEDNGFEEINVFLRSFYSTGIFAEKMKLYCEFQDSNKNKPEILSILRNNILDTRFENYYKYFGTSGCRSREYRETYLYSSMNDLLYESKLKEAIEAKFSPGDRYPVSFLKKLVGKIYSDLNISRTPKATDLGKYFKLIKTRITLPDKTVVNGFKLESL